jgi:hypothetical protein
VFREGAAPQGFTGVVREVWLSPGRFFRGLDPEGGWLRPALFSGFVLYLNILLGEVLQQVWIGEFNYGLLYSAAIGLPVSLLMAPLLVAGLTALVLTVLDGAPRGGKFGRVFRALGYATAILSVLWIPFAPLLAVPYGLYVATVAVKETLYVGWRQAAIAALVPLCAVLLVLLLLLGPSESYDLLLNPPDS